MKAILDYLKRTLVFLASHFIELGTEIYKAKDNVSTKDFFSDFLAVLRAAGMMLVFNILAIVIFVLLPQGRDVLLIASTDAYSFIFLVIGVFFWSVFSEFGVGYAIYVSDNSGHNLPDKRVELRRKLQKMISQIFLLAPYIIVITGMLVNRPASELMLRGNDLIVAEWAPLIIMYLLMATVASVYFASIKKTEEERNTAFANASQTWRDKLRRKIALSEYEQKWCDKLMGIYNDHVFVIHKSSNYEGKAKQDMETFINNFDTLPVTERNAFPQNPAYIAEESRVPDAFVLREYTEDYILGTERNSRGHIPIKEVIEEGSYRWIYFIPTGFYKELHLRLYIASALSIFFFLLIMFHVFDPETIGSPGLLSFAFAAWIGIYLIVLHIDYALLRRGKPKTPGMPVPPEPEHPEDAKWYQPASYSRWQKFKGWFSLRVIFLALLIISSWSNQDHPVRMNHAGVVDNRPSLSHHFKTWMDHYVADSNNLYVSSAGDTFYPVLFVCAEGGASRTGAYTSLLLGMLQDSLRKSNIDLRRTIYACSGVSGGSLGLSLFHALAYLNTDQNPATFSYHDQAYKFFSHDFLSTIIARLCYGEIVNYICPRQVKDFDRATALEEEFEKAYSGLTPVNHFGIDYLHLWDTTRLAAHTYPALFINTTEVETGLQCWLTNVQPDADKFYYSAQRDLLRYKIHHGINYSTMVNFSDRFPLFSPAGCLTQSEGEKLHYVDGGYVENTGSATMYEVLKVVGDMIRDGYRKDSLRYNVRPYVVRILFSEPGAQKPQINFINELSEILLGIYNTRAGRSMMAKEDLNSLVAYLHGELVNLPLTSSGNEVPMNWALSAKSLKNLDSAVSLMWTMRGDVRSDLCKLPFFDTACRKWQKLIPYKFVADTIAADKAEGLNTI